MNEWTDVDASKQTKWLAGVIITKLLSFVCPENNVDLYIHWPNFLRNRREAQKLGNCVGSRISLGCRHLIFRCVRLVGEEGCRCGISTVQEPVWYGSTEFSVRVPRNRCWTAHVRSGVVPIGTQVITKTSPFTVLQVRLLHHYYVFTKKIVSCRKVIYCVTW